MIYPPASPTPRPASLTTVAMVVFSLLAAACAVPTFTATVEPANGVVDAPDAGSSNPDSRVTDSSATVSTEAPSTTALLPEDPTERWRFELEAAGTELPGGGVEVFPGRRLVANYGSPVTFRLGLLGESDVERNLAQLEALAVEYQDSAPLSAAEVPVIPALELIVTVADWKPGPDQNYSRELLNSDVIDWVDAATEAGAYVILDLQPGRTDFLTQAKRYESLLRRPNVGLALDPEWRLGPDELHMRRIGSVEAAEVNTVVDYLTGLVRTYALPQKVLVLHQFRVDMLPDRELIVTPPELAVVIHADGQGSQGSKQETWAALHAQPTGPDQILWWGWKNFIEEDLPMATPAQVNAITPLPVVVTYQ